MTKFGGNKMGVPQLGSQKFNFSTIYLGIRKIQNKKEDTVMINFSCHNWVVLLKYVFQNF